MGISSLENCTLKENIKQEQAYRKELISLFQASQKRSKKNKNKKELSYRKELVVLFKESQKRERDLKMKLTTIQFYSKKPTKAPVFKLLQTEDLDSPLSHEEMKALNEISKETNLV